MSEHLHEREVGLGAGEVHPLATTANRIAARTSRAALKHFWIGAHRWLGLTLGAVGALLGITGSLLVYDTEIDALLNPQRYAVADARAVQPLGAYLDNARRALGEGARPMGLQLPRDSGPVIVTARGRDGAGLQRVYLDPGSARVLDVASGTSFVGWLHQFHGSLMLRELWGREFVGVVGIAMLVSALSGIYLWWPGRSRVRRALGFRRGFGVARNLHYSFGFYASIVLAVIAFTGVSLAYPDASRRVAGWFGPVSASPRSVTGAAPGMPMAGRAAKPAAGASSPTPATSPEPAFPGRSAVTPDQAAAIATSLHPQSTLTAIGLPAGGADSGGVYRISLREPKDPRTQHGGSTAVFVDAVTGKVQRSVDPGSRTAADTVLAWQSPLHTGEAFGSASEIVVFIVGFAPPLLFASGLWMWLRQRRETRLRSARGAASRPYDNARGSGLGRRPAPARSGVN